MLKIRMVQMIKERGKNGRFIKRVEGEYSNRFYTLRLTDSEFKLISKAKAKGVDLRGILLDGIRKVLNGSIQ